MNAADLTPQEFGQALWNQAKGLFTAEASVGVLISQGGWLYRRDLRKWADYCDDADITGGPPMAGIHWPKVVTAINAHRIAASSGELQMLQVAAGLAGYGKWSLRDMVDDLDRANLSIVLQALAHLRGWHERIGRVAVDGVFDTSGRCRS